MTPLKNYNYPVIIILVVFTKNLYNVYNRKNPFARFIVYEENEEGSLAPQIKEIVLFPFIPSFGINVNL